MFQQCTRVHLHVWWEPIQPEIDTPGQKQKPTKSTDSTSNSNLVLSKEAVKWTRGLFTSETSTEYATLKAAHSRDFSKADV